MPQLIHINLDARDLPTSVLKPGDSLVSLDSSEIEVVLVENGMESGEHSTAIYARLPNGEVGVIQISAKQLLNVAAAIKGRLVHLGVIPTRVNPGIAFTADPINHVVNFSAEAPLEHWQYTTEHAKEFWRLLKQFTEAADR
jgi:hypothetical protein